MKKFFILLPLLILAVFACGKKNAGTQTQSDTVKTKSANQINFKKFFDADTTTGCIVIYDYKNDRHYYHDSARCYRGFLPASTFKIPNSLFFLESGVLKDENEIIKWDGEKRWREEWNKDLNLREAYKYSAVWFYQECARRMGLEQMRKFVDTLNYGSKDISEGVDMFWLKGKMRITAMEQLDLQRKIYENKIPFKQRSIDILKDIMINEKGADYILRLKTGTAVNDDSKVGWLVGYLTVKDNVYLFALNVDITEDDWKFEERFSIMKNCFEEMGVVKFDKK
ncbi:MAG: class D beta-lactamase [Ignavibacteria bacterium]|nr:class D beta-lactamase [Ignavibacteria bacterium]